ncbi:putative 3-oxoacyl-(acyl-carrier-protein) synthase II [Photobacterium gaetbulicola Gung47]|uniref:Putative 3-oxoacyl-(Acyl-carrier-protein) synthase II n=1 Tax=Photobacterium gaetbulicola Gung47 TaxID=658445 RepID=A0A0C5WK02_9GAMM|nr:beta-ketoacyl-[acyl-carrier-protein] synthase family protein [Photobacterium gaetbulicola]AJR06552.1 putative 3-oxoacyl-(acyl-carrier-protein) synthase II [Photobacterium gaetbulicola Gung47]
MVNQKVVITGMGVISCYGHQLADFWQAISHGKNGIKQWSEVEGTEFPVQYASTVDVCDLLQAFPNWPVDTKPVERRVLFGALAAQQALSDADIRCGEGIGVFSCSGVPEINDAELSQVNRNGIHAFSKQTMAAGANQFSALQSGNDNISVQIAHQSGATGPVVNINGACAGAAQSIGAAFQAIRRGELQQALAGGADSVLNARTMSGLFLLGATATANHRKNKLCCPFDAERGGLVAGEGGAYLVLESESSARARGARIYAEVQGYGSSMDAYKVTAPRPDGRGAQAAMVSALADAGIKPDAIDYINAHGTSTPLNDKIETAAIKTIFGYGSVSSKGENGSQLPLVSATKSMIGHWISAAAAPEAIATVLAIHHGLVPPTINLQNSDPLCDLDYVPDIARPYSLTHCLSNSFGFGGINSSLVFGKYNE